jgi:hypothetical protein
VRFTVPDQPYVVLRRNLFVPAYAGLNFEHIHDGTMQSREVLFEPRNAPMQLRVIDDYTAELYQAPTPHWGLESCSRYQLLESREIELTFECIPHRAAFRNGYIGLFWASYIDQPESLDIHFIGSPSDEPNAAPGWIRGITPGHGERSTHLARDDQREFAHAPDFPLTLVFNHSRHRYTEPWYFGVCRDMAFAQLFRPLDQVRLSQSPSGGGAGNPAWDFQWFIPDYQVGRRHQLVMRAAYQHVAAATEEAAVREAVRAAVAPIPNVVASPPAHSREGVIKPFFRPPAEFAGQLGSYRSPLRFNNGTPVRSANDWQRRRAELLKQWHALMGPWPPLIEHPKVEVLSETRRDNFVQRRVLIEIAPGQTAEGWLLVPEGKGPFPAALVVYYEPDTSIGVGEQKLRDFGRELARRGFVTLSIGTPGGNARQPDLGSAACQPLSFHAYVAANCWQALANLPRVDRTRIGVVGHSYGGKWALFAAALWERFACVAVSDPGIVFDETRPNVNYWEPWYLGANPGQPQRQPGVPTPENPRTGAYRVMVETGRDLHELHALIAPRPLLVSGGAEDPLERWVALNHAVAVNDLLGFTNRVAMTSREGHTPTEESNAQLYDFFEHFLAR